ncbi:MAG: hypothetical protein ACTJLK_04865 [Anaplasma sp.]
MVANAVGCRSVLLLELIMRILLASCAVCCWLSLFYDAFAADSVSDSLDSGFPNGGAILVDGQGVVRSGSDVLYFSGMLLFYSWGGLGVLPEFSHGLGRGGSLRSVIRAGTVISRNLDWSGDCDFTGRMAFEYVSDSGVLYGADFQLLIPEVEGAVEGGKAMVNRGSKVFVLTPYGKFSVGYQEGVESSVISVVSSAGDVHDDFAMGRDPALVKYKLPALEGDLFSNGGGQWWLRDTALLYPGLYSEGVFRRNSRIDYYGLGEYSEQYSKRFVNNLPLRLSYQSPKIFGVRLGLSYSPSGYDKDLFRAWYYEDVTIGPKQSMGRQANNSAAVPSSGAGAVGESTAAEEGSVSQVFFQRILLSDGLVYAPAYRNVTSAALSFDHVLLTWGREIKVTASFAGEYAPADEHTMGASNGGPEGGFYGLAAFGASAGVGMDGFDLGVGFGYLGRSGYPKGAWEDTDVDWDRSDAYPAWRPSYYWVGGFGYGFGPLRAELSYFSSVKGGYISTVQLSDFGVRVGYELYRSVEVKCSLFGQFHGVSMEYDFAKGLVGEGGSGGHLYYGFEVFVFGVKLVF